MKYQTGDQVTSPTSYYNKRIYTIITAINRQSCPIYKCVSGRKENWLAEYQIKKYEKEK